MKTSQQVSAAKRFEPGNILYEETDGSILKMFLIAGASYEEVAMTRLLKKDQLNTELEKRCYRINNKVAIKINGKDVEEELFSDISRLVIKDNSTLSLLNKAYIGKVHKKDLKEIQQAILLVNTISEAVKNNFFGGK